MEYCVKIVGHMFAFIENYFWKVSKKWLLNIFTFMSNMDFFVFKKEC